MIAKRLTLAVQDGEPAVTFRPVPRGRFSSHEWKPLKAMWMPHGGLRVASHPRQLQLAGGVTIPYHNSLPDYIQRKARSSKIPCFLEYPGVIRTRDRRIRNPPIMKCKNGGKTLENEAFLDGRAECSARLVFLQFTTFFNIFQWLLCHNSATFSAGRVPSHARPTADFGLPVLCN